MNAQSYREDRTSAELDQFLHHCFYIPINHGITQKYVAENYPGWTAQQLEQVLKAAGVRVGRPGRPPVCHPDVLRMQFDSERSWRVEWRDGSVTEGPEPASTPLPADRPARVAPQSNGWPADEHPIFIDAGFGHVKPSARVIGDLGEQRELTSGATLRSDATAEQFAVTWADVLGEKPARADSWEYSVEMPRPEHQPYVTEALPLEEALERVRPTSGARLRRRAVGRWQIAPTPFPSLAKPGWAELEPEKQKWHAAMNEFPSSFRGGVSRMGGVDAAPSEWIEFARRAAAAGFTPDSYRMLGTAHLAWTARQAKSPSQWLRGREIPALTSIELWARFPVLIAEGRSPLEAIENIAIKRH